MTSDWRPLYTLSGSAIRTYGYPIEAAAAFGIGDIVDINAAGTVNLAAASNTPVLGISLETVAAGLASGPQTTRAIIHPFNRDTVYAVKDADGTATYAESDVGDAFELDLVSSNWGVADAGTSGTASTPQFICVDVDTVRNEWHVVIDPAGVAGSFQFVT